MLVLTRRPGEAIELSNGVRITFLARAGGAIRLGIDAPDDVAIRRAEAPHCIPDRFAEKLRVEG